MELRFLFSAHRLMVYICTKFHKKILEGIKVIERTQFSKISKGHNSIKNVNGIMVLFLCTSSDDSLYLYTVS